MLISMLFVGQYVDRWYKSCDQKSLTMSRRLIKEEGLLCGECALHVIPQIIHSSFLFYF